MGDPRGNALHGSADTQAEDVIVTRECMEMAALYHQRLRRVAISATTALQSGSQAMQLARMGSSRASASSLRIARSSALASQLERGGVVPWATGGSRDASGLQFLEWEAGTLEQMLASHGDWLQPPSG